MYKGNEKEWPGLPIDQFVSQAEQIIAAEVKGDVPDTPATRMIQDRMVRRMIDEYQAREIDVDQAIYPNYLTERDREVLRTISYEINFKPGEPVSESLMVIGPNDPEPYRVELDGPGLSPGSFLYNGQAGRASNTLGMVFPPYGVEKDSGVIWNKEITPKTPSGFISTSPLQQLITHGEKMEKDPTYQIIKAQKPKKLSKRKRKQKAKEESRNALIEALKTDNLQEEILALDNEFANWKETDQRKKK